MRRFLPIVLMLIWVTAAHSQTPGLDLLALPKYEKVGIDALPPHWALGVFTRTFGDGLPSIARACRTGRPAAILARLYWADAHGCDPRRFDDIAKEAARLNPVARGCGNIPVIATGWTEHDCNEANAKLLRKKVMEKCPECDGYSNSVNANKGAFLYDDPEHTFNEVHGQDPRLPLQGKLIVSYDGTPATDSDVAAWKQRHRNATYRLYHDSRLNGRWESSDTTPRPNRKGWPDAKMLRSEVYLEHDKGPVGKFDKYWLWKSHSENKGTGDWRAEKPVAIITEKANEISLVMEQGKELIRCSGLDGQKKRYSPMTTSPWSSKKPGYRYYCDAWGYELAEKALLKSGSALVQIKVGSKLGPKFNPAFRHDTYRK